MKQHQDFEAILGDPDHLQALSDIGKALSAEILAIEGFEAFIKRARALGNDSDAVFAAVRGFYTLDRVRQALAAEKQAFLATPTYGSTFNGAALLAQAMFVVARSPHFISLLTSIDPHMMAYSKHPSRKNGRTISFPSGHAEFIVLKGEMRCRVWTIDPFDDSTDLSAFHPHARPDEPVVLRAGDVLRQVDYQSLEFLPHDQGCVFLNTQMLDATLPVDLSCDIHTGRITMVNAGSSTHSRLQMLTTLMGLFDRHDAYETIAELLAEPQHFVRWHAMRELVGLDHVRALPALRAMAEEDPQPAVRRAARKTLALLQDAGATALAA
jgi:hypothetical protein